jgi:hypothetical protein
MKSGRFQLPILPTGHSHRGDGYLDKSTLDRVSVLRLCEPNARKKMRRAKMLPRASLLAVSFVWRVHGGSVVKVSACLPAPFDPRTNHA